MNMSPFFKHTWSRWVPQLNRQLWILFAGRLLSQIGTGFTVFYVMIFFVNQVGLSATEVGIGLGSASISGVAGRILGGSLSDLPFWGRRRTLLLATGISGVGSLSLAFAYNLASFVTANLIMGLGIGFYWPAAEAAVADLTTPKQRNEAYALNRLGDSLGLGLGVVLAGMLIEASGAYRTLFIIDAASFFVFFGVIYSGFPEPLVFSKTHLGVLNGWITVLSDRHMLIYTLVNIMFTTYIYQIHSTTPLYLSNFAGGISGEGVKGFSSSRISTLFTWHIVLAALCQLPVARALNRFSRTQALTLSALAWAVGFILIWAVGVAPTANLVFAVLGLGVLAIAMISYLPAASTLVVELAPDSLRGVYLSINSLCWAAGAFIGPSLGGFALDQPRPLADTLWLALAVSVGMAVLILQYLGRTLSTRV
jgi:MFS family permease